MTPYTSRPPRVFAIAVTSLANSFQMPGLGTKVGSFRGFYETYAQAALSPVEQLGLVLEVEGDKAAALGSALFIRQLTEPATRSWTRPSASSSMPIWWLVRSRTRPCRQRWRRSARPTRPCTGIHNLVAGAATAVGTSLMGWIIWWIQQR
ncbi:MULTISPECIES: hypothetical protein [unclassified Streptomyces]|uniref:hypothetical protein n=1 Tax=Streptomyces sp. NPDC058812 TaxID=3346639 RepID=UPI00367585A0